MAIQNFGSLVSFLFGIANDCLVDVYDVGDYRKIILPMIVIRRFDAVLEGKKQEILNMKAILDAQGITNQDDALCVAVGEAFFNTSPYTLKDLLSRNNKQQLKQDFISYLNGFSQNVQDIISRFEFHRQIDKLSEHNILGTLIKKFTGDEINLSPRPVYDNDGNIKHEALDNHTMGTVFEEIIRRFNEETNVTDAGRHFTPRDIVELIADLAFIPVKDSLLDTTYRIYDHACGTGGILTIAEERLKKIASDCGKNVSVYLFGQEIADETYAIAKSDILIKGEGKQADRIKFGSTISNDQLPGQTFDFMLSNPPFGTPWKTDLNAWGIKSKDEITDPRFRINYHDKDFSLAPDIGDPQMLFLANNISKMKTQTLLGSRIVEVHNGSSLFTGKAGQGPSNLRQYIMEEDLLEAIVALPEKMFYNTGIGTYLWVLANKKEPRRRGKIQLIDATTFRAPLRKNLGEKNSELTPEIRDEILKIYMAFDQADERFSRVLDSDEFGYWSVTIERPLRLRVHPERANLIPATTFKKPGEFENVKARLEAAADACDDWTKFAELTGLPATTLRKIRPSITDKDPTAQPIEGEPDPDLRDTEIIPLNYDGGIEGFMREEVLPYKPDAYIDNSKTQTGYEISFTKYFYQPEQLRTLTEISTDIHELERETHELLREILEAE